MEAALSILGRPSFGICERYTSADYRRAFLHRKSFRNKVLRWTFTTMALTIGYNAPDTARIKILEALYNRTYEAEGSGRPLSDLDGQSLFPRFPTLIPLETLTERQNGEIVVSAIIPYPDFLLEHGFGIGYHITSLSTPERPDALQIVADCPACLTR